MLELIEGSTVEKLKEELTLVQKEHNIKQFQIVVHNDKLVVGLLTEPKDCISSTSKESIDRANMYAEMINGQN